MKRSLIIVDQLPSWVFLILIWIALNFTVLLRVQQWFCLLQISKRLCFLNFWAFADWRIAWPSSRSTWYCYASRDQSWRWRWLEWLRLAPSPWPILFANHLLGQSSKPEETWVGKKCKIRCPCLPGATLLSAKAGSDLSMPRWSQRSNLSRRARGLRSLRQKWSRKPGKSFLHAYTPWQE